MFNLFTFAVQNRFQNDFKKRNYGSEKLKIRLFMGNIFNFGFGVKDPAFVCRLLDMLSESQRGRIFKALYDFDGQGAFPETTNRMLNLVLCVIAHQAGLAPAESLPVPAPSGTFSAEAPASSDSAEVSVLSAEALAAAEELAAAPAEEAEEGSGETRREIIEGGLKGGWEEGTIVRKNLKKEKDKEKTSLPPSSSPTCQACQASPASPAAEGNCGELAAMSRAVAQRAEDLEDSEEDLKEDLEEDLEEGLKEDSGDLEEDSGARKVSDGDEVTDADCTFDAVWELYGKKFGSVPYLRGRWERFPMSERREMVRYIRRYVAERPNPRFRRTFLNFLEQRTWQTQPLAHSRGSISIRSEIARIGEAEHQAEAQLATIDTDIDFKTLNEQCRIMALEQRL